MGGALDNNLIDLSEQRWSIRCEGGDEEASGLINKRKKE